VQFLTNAATQHIQQVNSHLIHYHSNRGSSANTIIQRTYKTTFYTCRHIHSLNEYVRKPILHPQFSFGKTNTSSTSSLVSMSRSAHHTDDQMQEILAILGVYFSRLIPKLLNDSEVQRFTALGVEVLCLLMAM
jgi:hypothetical protein